MSNNILITEELIKEHGLSSQEYEQILQLLQRTPTITELGIFSAMWNEHCSYKSSKKYLRELPTKGKCVIQGPGENAGVVDIGDGDCVVFKIESHNHPSYIEPYQGAATGVGGILRDIFTMGARPIASLNALRFGAPSHPRTQYLVKEVVAGIGGYANSFGVPTVGGEVNFDASYNGNILVNAFAAGIAKTDKLFYSKAKGVGLPIIYLGAKTGRDGVGGATMASAEFADNIEEKRPTVQVGDPFTEKKLLEACLELMQTGAVIAIQDMGAAGLTCSAVEMGAKGNLGIKLNLDHVPTREPNMSAYEMLLSESQERMLMVLDSSKRSIAEAIFQKWSLDFAQIGETIEELRFKIYHAGQEVANLPIKELGDMAPEYDREWVNPPAPLSLNLQSIPDIIDIKSALLKMLNSPNLSSRRWVFEQYDSFIQGQTIVLPGSDAGVVKMPGLSSKALAFSCDVTPRYCQADPFEGGKQAVAECWRNLCATGAKPLAASDNLNFGNPEKPETMGQLVLAIRGITEACNALDFPIVSGNVSLYNETNGQAIKPTPTIAGVGLLNDWEKTTNIAGMQDGDKLYMIGKTAGELGQSLYLKELFDLEAGTPPIVDLHEEKKNGEFIQQLSQLSLINACHDIADGGLLISLAEMCIAADKGVICEKFDTSLNQQRLDALLFAEDQSRYIVAVNKDNENTVLQLAAQADIQLSFIGNVGGKSLDLLEKVTITCHELRTAFESWFPKFMNIK